MLLKRSGRLDSKPHGETRGHGKQALPACRRASRGTRGNFPLGENHRDDVPVCLIDTFHLHGVQRIRRWLPIQDKQGCCCDKQMGNFRVLKKGTSLSSKIVLMLYGLYKPGKREKTPSGSDIPCCKGRDHFPNLWGNYFEVYLVIILWY